MSVIKGNGAGEASGFYTHTIDQSLRFEDGDSPALTRTPSSAGNRKTWTWSAWIKRGNISANQFLFQAYDGASSRRSGIKFNSDNTIAFDQGGGASSGLIDTVAVYRDVSSFYHIVVVADYSNGTAGNRAKIYVNGVLQTVTTSDDFENDDGLINSTNEHSISRASSGSFDGYMSEVNFIDGTALGPDSFGETKDGIWVAKNVSGLTYGTNGFHLDFADSSAIGNDVSGQNNDFAVSGGGSPTLVASDVVPDSPTNNFAVMNVLDNKAVTLSEGNLRCTPTGDYKAVRGNFAIPLTGKWFFEARVTTDGGGNITDQFIGIATDQNVLSGSSPYAQAATYGVLYKLAGTIGRLGSDAETGLASFAAGDVLGVAINSTDNEVQFYKNGSTVGSAVALPSTTRNSFAFFAGATNRSSVFNFGQDSTFNGAVSAGSATDGVGTFQSLPTGFKALCSANLDEPDIIDGSEYFNTVLWTGTGNDDLEVTGVGFSPSWSWMKRRDATGDQLFFDVVRGNGKQLKSAGSTNSPGTSAESTQSNKQKTFTADGFTLGTDATVNTNNGTYVAWNWLAGGSASSNSDGTITSSISANPEAGFSIVSFTHDGTNASTIGHGLGKKPTAIIMKQRSASSNWRVFHSGLADGKNILLNSSNAVTTAGDIFQTAPTNTVFTSGNGDSGSGKTYIAYCFTDIEGYCKAGVYIGNANPDGPYVNLGFRPAFLLIKRSDSASHWVIIDTKRSPSNEITAWLGANLTSSESSLGTNNEFDILSNGFKNRNDAGADIMNQSGASYIYLAFAEQPFKYSNAR